MTALRVTHVRVNAGPAELLRDVSVDFAKGQWHGVVGPNGAGKTTLLETIVGLREPSAGAVFVGEHSLHLMRPAVRAQHVAYIPQHPVFPEGMSVASYVALGRTAHHSLLRPLRDEDRDVVRQTLERLDLASVATRSVTTLSGGERQRVVVARALTQEAPILVLDEPITSLDVRHQLEILALVRREVTERGVTVISSLHDLTLAGQITDRLVVIANGAVALEGATSEVLQAKELATSFGVGLQVVVVDGVSVVVPRTPIW